MKCNTYLPNWFFLYVWATGTNVSFLYNACLLLSNSYEQEAIQISHATYLLPSFKLTAPVNYQMSKHSRRMPTVRILWWTSLNMREEWVPCTVGSLYRGGSGPCIGGTETLYRGRLGPCMGWTHRLTDTHDRKLYLPATSLADGNEYSFF